MASSSSSTSLQTKAIGLALVVFTLLASSQGQQPNNVGANPQTAGTGPNSPFQGQPGSPPQPMPPQQQGPAGAGFRRRGPFPRSGIEGPMAGGPGRGIPPEVLARRMAFLQAAARARAMQEATTKPDINTLPYDFGNGLRPRAGRDEGRPVMVPTGVPQFPHPQGIPTRQGGNRNKGSGGGPGQPRGRAKRERGLLDGTHRRSARAVQELMHSEEEK
ncbi:uncharacterized protein [Dermacentor andersoni]|uniref:uncharacterized protein n=1 Tax=Dermacentor andersoni TaxID=34620 RepID=UPI002155E194|nr:basic salivary proline-rich protein 3-like [Dermacentor andersoni]